MTIINLILTVILALLIPFVIGIILLNTKTITGKTKKTLGLILLIPGIINLLFSSIAAGYGEFIGTEIIGVILYFILALVMIITGIILLIPREIRAHTRIIFGISLVIISLLYFFFINFSY